MQYVKVSNSEAEEPIEIPAEDEGTLLFTTISSQYPGITGLRYRLGDHIRAVKITNNKFYPPEDGWNDLVYFCVYPKSKLNSEEEIHSVGKYSLFFLIHSLFFFLR